MRWVLVCAIAVGACGKGESAPVGIASAEASGVQVEPDPAPASAREPAPARAPAPAPAPASRPKLPGTPAAPALRPVFSLADNELLAHRTVEGHLFIDAGSPAFARYGRASTGWSVRRWVGDVPVAVVSRRRGAVIQIPIPAASARTSIWMRVHAGEATKIAIRSGRKTRRLELEPGWQTTRVELPVAAGEPTIRLSGARGIAVEWIQIGGDATPSRLSPLVDGGDLVLARGEGAAYYVFVPRDARIIGDVIGDGCAAEVRATARDGQLSGALGEGEGVSLAELAGQIVRLEVTVTGCPSARIAGAAIAAPGAEPALPAPGAPPRHILLWVMDTLRADRVRPFTPGARPEVPNFERLAARGVVFRQAYVQGNESQTSHASLWTGVYPAVHGVRTAGVGGVSSLRSSFVTLPELIKERGFATYAVTANGMITDDGGYADGFDEFDNQMRDGSGRRNAWIPAEHLVERALVHMGRDPSERWFMFLGTIDTHKPWVGHEPWLSRYDPGPYRGPFETRVRPGDIGIRPGSMRCVDVPRSRDLERINAIYDSDVSYQDDQLGVVMAKLEAWGILDDTMIIVTADHGEELWEVGRCGHGASLRETLVRVPLLVSYPPMFPPGTVVDEGVDVLDVFPTVIEALGGAGDRRGARLARQLQGASLRPLSHGAGRGYPRASYASQYEYAHTMRIGSWKLRVGRGVELYDLGADPGERHSIAGERPLVRRFLTDPMWLFLESRERWNKRTWGPPNNMTAAAANALLRSRR